MVDLLFFSKMIDMIITRRSDQALIIVGGVTLNNIERRDKEIAYISDDSVMDELIDEEAWNDIVERGFAD